MRDLLALVSVSGLSVGILIGSLSNLPFTIVCFLGLLSAGFFLAWFFGKRDAYLVPMLFLLFIALGLTRVASVPQALPPALNQLLGSPVTLHGVVVSDPDVRETTQHFIVAIDEHGAKTKVLAVTERYPSFSYGDEVTVNGTLSLPEPFDTEGGRTFAYDRFLAKDGIFSTIKRAHVTHTGTSASLGVLLLRPLYGTKHMFARGMEAALPEPAASLAEGLIVGGKQGLGSRLIETFTISGLLPIIVLSGYNVMIVAEAILVGLAFIPRRFSFFVAGVTILLFVTAAGASASALRAGLMAVLALFTRATHHTYAALRALIGVFVLLIVWSPLSLAYDPGLQFSFVATLGLILLSDPIQSRLKGIQWGTLREVVATTLAAQCFVLPLLLFQTGTLSLVAIPANILVLPVIPLTMLLAAVTGFVGMMVPVAAPYIGLPAYALLSYVIAVAELAAKIPFALTIVPAFPVWLLAVMYTGIALVTLRVRKTAPAFAGAVLRTTRSSP